VFSQTESGACGALVEWTVSVIVMAPLKTCVNDGRGFLLFQAPPALFSRFVSGEVLCVCVGQSLDWTALSCIFMRSDQDNNRCTF
jgi:hypothetical protein